MRKKECVRGRKEEKECGKEGVNGRKEEERNGIRRNIMEEGGHEGVEGDLKIGAGVVFRVPACSLSLYAPLSVSPTNLWLCCEETMGTGVKGGG